ncbi:uncharacterized protein LOC131056035 [Cryptomeria japonica]|uniref:uncharacterized protein LOC131056035 n=1 Tax=Cryptomeria japonica TaxID=3369 RepID=UPI0025AC0E95|nr:uncharacterized protein LOC131056035 [Cryptomeria japonica]
MPMLASPNMQTALGFSGIIFSWMNRGSAPRCSISHSGCWAKPYNNYYHHQSFLPRKMPGTITWAANGQGPEIAENIPKPLGKRKVVEHVVLFRTKEGFSDEKEKDMLDFLYTSQYYMKGIIAISLGRILNENVEGCTHALYMRFPSKEVLAQYYRNPFQSRVLNEYIIPYCHGSISLDFEAEVQDDIIPLFRRGEDFEYGVEFFLLISVKEHVSVYSIREALDAFKNLIQDFGSTIIQHTQGSNLSNNNKDYTHGIVIRFPSEEALNIFTSSSLYADVWKQKIFPISGKTLMVYVLIDPVGKTLM